MIKLWEKEIPYFNAEYNQEEPCLTPFLLDDGKVHPCIIVLAGGGYDHRAEHEGAPIAKWLNTVGINAFVLAYRFAPYTRKAILGDALRAVRLVRSRAEEFNIDPEKVGVIGFSAGGHLAAMTALRHADAELSADDPVDAFSSRPDVAVLCYPVISFQKFPHLGSAKNFLGAERKLLQMYSAEQLVTEDAPPMFLWHAADDPIVPVENSIMMALALREKKIPFALHIYPRGGHGKNLAIGIPETCRWPETCAAWISNQFGIEGETF